MYPCSSKNNHNPVRTVTVFWPTMYVCMHQLCSITRNVQYFFQKYLCNFITELHNVPDWASTDSYCSCFSVLT